MTQKVAELSFVLQVLQNIVVSQLQYTTHPLHASKQWFLAFIIFKNKTKNPKDL